MPSQLEKHTVSHPQQDHAPAISNRNNDKRQQITADPN